MVEVRLTVARGNVTLTSALLYSGFGGNDSRITDRYAIVNGTLERNSNNIKNCHHRPISPRSVAAESTR